jgi:hypothetical protein
MDKGFIILEGSTWRRRKMSAAKHTPNLPQGSRPGSLGFHEP